MDYQAFSTYFPTIFSLLLVLLLGIMRLLPIIILAPFYGARLAPGPVKMGFAIALSIVFIPQLAHITDITKLHFNFMFIMYSLKEIGVGLVLGFLVSVPFTIASSSGALIDFQRGSMSLMVFNPAMGEQTSPLGNIYNYTLIVAFFIIGGPALFLDSVSASYNLIPPTSFINPTFFSTYETGFWHVIIIILAEIVRISAQLAAPALVAMFMSDLFLGIANRLAQQVPMSFLGWALKSLIGLGVLWAGWHFILNQLELEARHWLDYIDHTMQTANAVKK